MAYHPPERDATVCHWCRHPFEPGQARYLIDEAIKAHPGWERVSLCGLCWKTSDGPTDMRDVKCWGCGEPMKVPNCWRPWPAETSRSIKAEGYIVKAVCCSNRCHQRARRMKRQDDRRGQRCAVCKETFEVKRTDRKYCSNTCRQWAYRRRKMFRGTQPTPSPSMGTVPSNPV